MDVDEDIDLYHNCLDDDDRNWTSKEEDLLWHYGVCTWDWTSLKKVRGGKLKHEKMHLQGIHSYDILRNPNYHQAFQYFASDLADRPSYIVDGNEDEKDDCAQSDLVRLVLNLAFLPRQELESHGFKFEANQCLKMKEVSKTYYNNCTEKFEDH